MSTTTRALYVRRPVLDSSTDHCAQLRSSLIAAIEEVDEELKRYVGNKKIIFQVQWVRSKINHYLRWQEIRNDLHTSASDQVPHYTVRVLVKRRRRYALHVYDGGADTRLFRGGGDGTYWNENRMQNDYYSL